MPKETADTLRLRFSRLSGAQESEACILLFAALVTSAELGEVALESAKAQGLGPELACEAILQSFLFAGFPRCINGLVSFRKHYGNDVCTARPNKIAAADIETFRQRGENLFRKIYAQHADDVLLALDAYHSDLRDWIIVDAYGKILSRPALTPKLRELCAVAGLLVSGDTRQLSSHMRGAFNCGAQFSELKETIGLIGFLIDKERQQLAHTVLQKLA